MTLRFVIAVHGADQLGDLSRALKQAGRGDLQKRMRANIRDAARPVLADVKQSARSIPAQPGPPTSGLRRRMAAATGLRIRRDGVRIAVSETRMGSQRSLPRNMEKHSFRHPVFGNRDRWVVQAGHPWFYGTVRRHETSLRRAVLAAVSDTADELQRSVR